MTDKFLGAAQHTPRPKFVPTPYCLECGKILAWGSFCNLVHANAYQAARELADVTKLTGSTS